MKIKFDKYQGAGNDFIILTEQSRELSQTEIAKLCDRRFGIGADGLMIVLKSEKHDFKMKYYNSDGFEGSMCGNGGRCIAKYAIAHKLASDKMVFEAIDGLHHAKLMDNFIHLSMNNVSDIKEYDDGLFLNTGSPHFVKFVDNINSIDVYHKGLELADDSRFSPERTNVNFVEFDLKTSKIATFERGVENETLACGTGTVAAAIALNFKGKTSKEFIKFTAKGGNLSVGFTKYNNTYKDIVLSGPAEFVFTGEIEL